MFYSFPIFTLLLFHSNAQMRPSNWDLDILKFDQRDWDKFGQDIGQNGRRPFPSFRPNRIPTQQPPIVGQIPGQIGKGGQSGNDKDPPPLPPMPRKPEEEPTDQNGNFPEPPRTELPPDNQPPIPGPGMEAPSDEKNPPSIPGPGMEAPPDEIPEVEAQSQPPTSTVESGNGEGMDQSETPPPMSPTPASSGEVTTSLNPEMDIPGFRFGEEMGFPGLSEDNFRLSGEKDVLGSFSPPDGGIVDRPGQSMGEKPIQDPEDLSGGLRKGLLPPVMGEDSSGLGVNVVSSTPLPVSRSPKEEQRDFEGMGVGGGGSRPPRGS